MQNNDQRGEQKVSIDLTTDRDEGGTMKTQSAVFLSIQSRVDRTQSAIR